VQLLLRGTHPATARRQLKEYIDAGARHLVIAPVPPAPPLPQIVDEIIEPLRQD
jgi:alkanesulfonate monooxygenase SsuD/methylene tetrahydromethanopterin reductase-like flavin-dependent oxidoreductase (luciferase family)